MLPYGLRLLVRGGYLCMSLVRSGVKLVVGFWVWCWWWNQSYLSREMRRGEAAAPDGRWIHILRVYVLFHAVFGGGSIVVYAEVCG